MGLVWEDAGEDLFEPVFKRNSALAKYQGIFHSFPDHDEWRMSDLYSRHPTEPDVWKYEGRRDDMIILNHGENIPPADLEHQLQAVTGIEYALLIGNQRPTLALLLQVDPAHMAISLAVEEVLARIWPVVQAINETVGPLAEIKTQRILLADAERPFIVTKKGAVSRKRTLALYERDIEYLYI
jgi:long-subunit acyl-CoA synthetase (AMP-forming)